MALFTTLGLSLQGLTGRVVRVEADLANGLPAFTIVGLPDTSLNEARDRVRAAVSNSDYTWPSRRLTVNLSPASLPKQGSTFDVAIAAAVLGCVGLFPPEALADAVAYGELGLDGSVRASRGVLPAVAAAAQAGVGTVIVPFANEAEARLVPDIRVVAVRHLREVVAFALGTDCEQEWVEPAAAGQDFTAQQVVAPDVAHPDMAEVLGQPFARWVLEIAATGGHHLLMVGPPGAGKTMLAERLPGLLPPLLREHALEVTSLASLAGTLHPGVPLVEHPPWQQPHHTASVAALVGGGSGGAIKPGAASLAHRGVLFLDEAPEFKSAALQALREPLESGTITVARAAGSASFPARFQLILAANPCPCGFGYGRGEGCVCPPLRKRSYFSKLSGPLLDRMDLHLVVEPPRGVSLTTDSHEETTTVVAGRVIAARDRAAHRYRQHPWRTNAEVPGRQLRRDWPLPDGAATVLEDTLRKGHCSLRGADRVVRVAWTLADLAGCERPGSEQIHSALALRTVQVAGL